MRELTITLIDFISLDQGKVFSKVPDQEYYVVVDETQNCELDNNKVGKLIACRTAFKP